MRIFIFAIVAALIAPIPAHAQSQAMTCLTLERRLSTLSDAIREAAIMTRDLDIADIGARAPTTELSRSLMSAADTQRSTTREMLLFSEALDRAVAAARACAR